MGYRAALDEAGLTFDPALIESAGLWHQAEGAEAVKRLLASGVEFDGVFAMNDALALGVLRVLHQERMRIPEEVAVIGFDNIDEGQYAMPSLTTVDPGRAEIARQAVDLLVERIARRAPIDEPREVLVDFEVLRRESA